MTDQKKHAFVWLECDEEKKQAMLKIFTETQEEYEINISVPLPGGFFDCFIPKTVDHGLLSYFLSGFDDATFIAKEMLISGTPRQQDRALNWIRKYADKKTREEAGFS